LLFYGLKEKIPAEEHTGMTIFYFEKFYKVFKKYPFPLGYW
jgi:hypothetical protein